MKNRTLRIDEKSTRIALIVRVFYESISAILFPLVIFGGGGWYMDRWLGTGRVFLFSGVVVAFVITQIVLFMKVRQFSRNIDGLVGKKGSDSE